MIVLPLVEGYSTNPNRWKFCFRIVDGILGIVGLFYIIALSVSYEAVNFSCTGSDVLDSAWKLSLASTVGRTVTTFLLVAGCCLKSGLSKPQDILEGLSYFAFILETVPGVLLFHMLITSDQGCLIDFMSEYKVLSAAILMQGYICFALLVLAALWFLYTVLLFLLGDRDVWSRDARAAGILDEEEDYDNVHGYVIKDKQVFI